MANTTTDALYAGSLRLKNPIYFFNNFTFYKWCVTKVAHCSASRGYHFATLTSYPATGSTFTILVVIIRVWFESCSYQEITKAFGASESHDWFALVNILQLI